ASVFAKWPACGLVIREAFTNSTNPICAASYPSFEAVFNCVITHGPACNTVIGCTSPFSSKTCVMPIFFPTIPVTAMSRLTSSCDQECHRTAGVLPDLSTASRGFHEGFCARRARLPHRRWLFLKRLDLHIHTRRQI